MFDCAFSQTVKATVILGYRERMKDADLAAVVLEHLDRYLMQNRARLLRSLNQVEPLIDALNMLNHSTKASEYETRLHAIIGPCRSP